MMRALADYSDAELVATVRRSGPTIGREWVDAATVAGLLWVPTAGVGQRLSRLARDGALERRLAPSGRLFLYRDTREGS
jgi:hypothetical protein